MTVYVPKGKQRFFADGMPCRVDPDGHYEETHQLVVLYPDAFEAITTLDGT